MSDRTRLRGNMRGVGDGGVEWRHTLRDRLILLDDPGEASDWSIQNAKTSVENIAIHGKSILYKESIGFDKKSGNAAYAGILKAFDNPIDVSRFLPLDHIEVCAFIPSLTDISGVRITLGSGTPNIPFYNSDYKTWLRLDSEWAADQFFTRTDTLCTGLDVGNGWDPEALTWMCFTVNFDAASDALANIVLDSVMIRAAI